MTNLNSQELEMLIASLDSYRAQRSGEIIQKAMADGIQRVLGSNQDSSEEVEKAHEFLSQRRAEVEVEISVVDETVTLLKAKLINIKNEIVGAHLSNELSDILNSNKE